MVFDNNEDEGKRWKKTKYTIVIKESNDGRLYSFVLYSLTQNDRENKFIMSKLKQNPTRPKSIFINDLRPAMLSL